MLKNACIYDLPIYNCSGCDENKSIILNISQIDYGNNINDSLIAAQTAVFITVKIYNI